MIDVTADEPTLSEPTNTYKHAVYPFPLDLDPMECNGYPPTYIKNEPEHELNFFLTDAIDQTQQDEGGKKKRGRIFKKILRKEVKKNAYVEPKRSSLACSLASREEISFEQLQNQVSSSPSENNVKTKPVIIICHGAMSWRNQMILANLVADTPKVLVHLKKDSSVRVLTIHGHQDEVVSVQNAFRFDEEIANHSLHVIKQANHNFNGIKYLDEMVEQIVTFYKSVYNET